MIQHGFITNPKKINKAATAAKNGGNHHVCKSCY